MSIDGEVHELKLGRSFDADGSVAFHSMHCEYSLVTDRTLHSTTGLQRKVTRRQLVWLGSLVVSVSDPMTARSGVRSLTTALSSNNLGQVVHTPQLVGAMP